MSSHNATRNSNIRKCLSGPRNTENVMPVINRIFLLVYVNNLSSLPQRYSTQWAKATLLTMLHDHTQWDAPQSVGFLWTRDRHVAETSTWQHTTLTRFRHPCPQWESNPQSQEVNARRPTLQIARPLWPANITSYLNKTLKTKTNFK